MIKDGLDDGDRTTNDCERITANDCELGERSQVSVRKQRVDRGTAYREDG